MDSSIVLEEAAEEGNLYTSADAEVWIYLSDLSVSDLFASWQESDRKRKGNKMGKEPHAGARKRTKAAILAAQGDVESSSDEESSSDDDES